MSTVEGNDRFEVAGRSYGSRLILGSSRYPNPQVMLESLEASGTELVTVSIRRIFRSFFSHIFQQKAAGRALDLRSSIA